MKKQDITKGALYAVRAPGGYSSARQTVIAEAVEVGVERDDGRRHVPARMDGVVVRLCEPWPFDGWIGDLRVERLLPAGHEFVCTTLEVVRPVEEKDRAQAAERARIRGMNAKAEEMLRALGLPKAKRGQRFTDEDAVLGFTLDGDGTTRIDTATLIEWLERIDPVEQARIAIRAVYQSRPMDEDDFEEAVDVALNEVRGFLSREPQQPPAPPVEQAPSADGVEF